MLNSGPPELPGLIATSVWMNGTKFSCGSERPLAETMPAVTVFSKPNGEPIATTHSPTRRRVGSPNFTAGSVPVVLDLDQRDVGALVGADHLGLEFALVGELDGDLVGALDDVRVGQDVAVRGDDEARAERAALRARSLLRPGLLPRNEAAEEFLDLLVVHARDLRQVSPGGAPPAWY